MTTKGKVLIITDSPDDSQEYIRRLIAEGYEVRISKTTGSFNAIQAFHPFVIIINFDDAANNPGVICKSFRLHKELIRTNIIVLSCFNDEELVIKTLETGADFYLIKPVSSTILVTKVNSIKRRFHNFSDSMIQVGDVIIDREKYIVLFKNMPFILPPKEFELLSLLISKKEKVFLRNELLNIVWKNTVDIRTVDVHIHKLRKKLGLNFIKTIKGVGYKVTAS